MEFGLHVYIITMLTLKTELMDKIELGLGYSFNVWNKLYIDPNYTMPAKERRSW